VRSERVQTVLSIAFAIAVLFAGALMAGHTLKRLDFNGFWIAAHLFSKNPYSFELTAKLSGVANAMPIKNPPWAILLILPLVIFHYYEVAFAFWAVISIVVVAGCARVTWSLSKSEESLAPALLSLLFGPTVVLLMLGQVTILVLLGVVLFVVLARQQRYWLAGACLLLISVKPHIAFLFLIAVVLWTVHAKRWAIFLAGGIALVVSSGISFAINPAIFAQYVERVRVVTHEEESYQNLGGMLYSVSGHHVLALVPQVIGVVWVVIYWWKHRDDWDWPSHGLLVLLVSCTCSYYSRPYDEILAIPALVMAFARGNRWIFLAGFIATNLGYALYLSNIAGRMGFDYMFLWWTASGWLLTYILSQKFRGSAIANAA
jgi:Glycosyltransferase family 87